MDGFTSQKNRQLIFFMKYIFGILTITITNSFILQQSYNELYYSFEKSDSIEYTEIEYRASHIYVTVYGLDKTTSSFPIFYSYKFEISEEGKWGTVNTIYYSYENMNPALFKNVANLKKSDEKWIQSTTLYYTIEFGPFERRTCFLTDKKEGEKEYNENYFYKSLINEFGGGVKYLESKLFKKVEREK